MSFRRPSPRARPTIWGLMWRLVCVWCVAQITAAFLFTDFIDFLGSDAATTVSLLLMCGWWWTYRWRNRHRWQQAEQIARARGTLTGVAVALEKTPDTWAPPYRTRWLTLRPTHPALPHALALHRPATDAQSVTGEPLFDMLLAATDDPSAQAVTDARARRGMVGWLEQHDARIAAGRLWLGVVYTDPRADMETRVEVLNEAARFARSLALKPGQRWAERMVDSLPGERPRVAAHKLELLHGADVSLDLWKTARAHTLDHLDAAVRVECALAIRDRATLGALIAESGLDDRQWIRVLQAYAELSDAEALSTLDVPEARLTPWFEELARRGRHVGDPRRTMRATQSADPNRARAAARALRFVDAPGRDACLIPLLDHPDDSVVLAAIESLAAVGGVEAVAPLLGHADAWFGGRRKRAATQAIARIQARFGDVEAGGLSVVDDAGGALTVIDPETRS